jgi:hypothetical protein
MVLIKFKRFYISECKENPKDGEKITSYLLDKELIYSIYEQLKKLNIKRKNTSLNKWAS